MKLRCREHFDNTSLFCRAAAGRSQCRPGRIGAANPSFCSLEVRPGSRSTLQADPLPATTDAFLDRSLASHCGTGSSARPCKLGPLGPLGVWERPRHMYFTRFTCSVLSVLLGCAVGPSRWPCRGWRAGACEVEDSIQVPSRSGTVPYVPSGCWGEGLESFC